MFHQSHGNGVIISNDLWKTAVWGLTGKTTFGEYYKNSFNLTNPLKGQHFENCLWKIYSPYLAILLNKLTGLKRKGFYKIIMWETEMKLIFQFPFGLLRYRCLTTGASSGCVSSPPNVSDGTDYWSSTQRLFTERLNRAYSRGELTE